MDQAVDDRFCLAGGMVEGRFAIDRAVAQGGSGIVYRATHIELGAPVALKVLLVPEHLRGLESSLEERFRQEARTLALLSHTAVVRVLDVGRLLAQGVPCVWMALEWLEGVTLDVHLRALEDRRLSPREALALFAPALDAIACAHERGIVHRDLKPSNIMVVPSRRGDVAVRVLDFGIAKAMEAEEAPGTGQTETCSDFAAFSLPYAAPEQVGRMRTGPWTDVHALGLLLTEALTGDAPYAGDDSFALYASIMSPERPGPSRRGVRVGPWEAILARALALHPRERFANARALYLALEGSLDEAQRAWEAPAAPTPRPDARRRGVSLAGAGAVALSLLALTALAYTRASGAHTGRVEVERSAPTTALPSALVAPTTTPPPVQRVPAPAALVAPLRLASTEASTPTAPRRGLGRTVASRPPRPHGPAVGAPSTPATTGPEDIVME